MANKQNNLFARQRILISRIVICPLALVLFLTSSAWEAEPPIDGLIFFAGCIFVGIATIGRLWCSLYICGRKTKELVTNGPYSMCRNPLYLFSAIGAIGVGLATETFTVPAVLILLFTITYPGVIRSEESRLMTLHGEEYTAYISATPRFLPRPALCHESDSYEVAPASFRRAMFDALWFVWLVGLLELAESLREAGIIPVILKLY